MQIVSCEVLLGGDLTNTVVKHGVSVPEIAILSQIHGIGSVRRLKIDGKDNRTTAWEKDRLTANYGEKIVSKLFPGAVPQFPKYIKDLGLSASDDNESADDSKESISK